jgi:hypothetical protein
MSLASARAELLAAIEAVDIKAYYGSGAFTTPCARIFPANPWVGPSALADGKRTQRWEIWAVAGRVDSGATYDELEALVQSISNATENMRNWSRINWDRPVNVQMGGVLYSASRGVAETREMI